MIKSDHKRILKAAIVSPLVIPLSVMVVDLFVFLTFGRPVAFVAVLEIGVFLLLIGYLTMLVFGIPAYLLLRRLKLASLWSAAGTGYLSGIVMDLLLRGGWPHISLTPQFHNPMFLVGAAVGAVFWLLVRPRPGFSAAGTDQDGSRSASAG